MIELQMTFVNILYRKIKQTRCLACGFKEYRFSPPFSELSEKKTNFVWDVGYLLPVKFCQSEVRTAIFVSLTMFFII